MQYTAYLILAPISIVILLAVFGATRRYRSSAEILALRWLLVAVIGWLFFDSLEVLAPDPSMTLFWAKVSYLFIAITPVCWLNFAVQYGSSGTRPCLRRPGFWLFLLIPTVTVLLLWSPVSHHLVWAETAFVPVEGFLALQVEHGIAFWAFIVHGYALVVLGALFIVRHHVTGLPLYRFQSQWLLIGVIVPLLINLVYVFRLAPDLRKDYTPIGFAMAGIAFSIGMLWHGLFDLKPIARATVIDRLVDPVMTMDLEGRLIDFNPAAGKLLAALHQAKQPAALIGVPFHRGLQGWPALVDYVDSDASESEDLILEWDGVTRFYECCTSVLLSPRARPIGRLVILHDITERKETESVLRYHMAELEAGNEYLDAFAHTVAHDLKGPLATILGYAEMLNLYLNQWTLEQMQEHLDDLAQTARRMVQIIDALLLFSRVHRQQNLALDCIDMADVVAESLDRVSVIVMEKGARVVMPPAWPAVLGHGLWIVEVWVNYLTNALKYGGSPPVIELGYDWNSSGVGQESFVRFWVRDGGSGLTESEIRMLFVPFTRLHDSEAPGHGLGLSIVRRIVEQLGGQVGVESAPGDGSTFWFTLMAAEAVPESAGTSVEGGSDAMGESDVAGF